MAVRESALFEERENFVSRLMACYQETYDCEEYPFFSENDIFRARLTQHVRESGFALIRQAEMWSCETDSTVWVHSSTEIEPEEVERILSESFKKALSEIKLAGKKDHMRTNAIVIFLTDQASPETLRKIKKSRLYKNFLFSLKGWLEVHAVIVDFSSKTVTSNPYGRETKEVLLELLKDGKHKKRKGRTLRLLKEALQ